MLNTKSSWGLEIGRKTNICYKPSKSDFQISAILFPIRWSTKEILISIKSKNRAQINVGNTDYSVLLDSYDSN